MSEMPTPALHPLDERCELPVLYADIMPSDRYVPINGDQVDDLKGKMLTVLDALGLSESQGKAAKSMVRQFLDRWYAEATSNAETSYRGCLAPIVALRDVTADGHPNGRRKYVWLAEGNHAVSMNL